MTLTMNTFSRMKRPSSWWEDNWREGTPLGNGQHGALIYGYMAKERIMLTHARLWREGKSMPIPSVSDVLPQMRSLIFDHKVPKADRMLADALMQRGYAPHEAYPFPAADITLTLPNLGSFSEYNRELDMETAQGFVSYNRGGEMVRRRAFVSRADDVVVIECHRDTDVEIGVHMPDTRHFNPASLPQAAATERDGDYLYFRAVIGGKEHGAVLRIVRGETTLILARVYTDGEWADRWKSEKKILEALPADYDLLLNRHIPLHKELFNRCRLRLKDDIPDTLTNEELIDIAYEKELPNALVERMWNFGRYLFICSTTQGGLPCGLTGLWNGEYRPFWAFYMANINLQMTYWHANPGNLTELMMPFFDYFDNAMDDFRENARQIFGCRGIYIPAVTMPGGTRHVCLAPHITNWTAGAGWIAAHYFDYWLYTGDRDFLENRAIPFMKEAALFYLDFIQWDESGWHICPSVSPENHTRHYCCRNRDLGDPSQPHDLGDGVQTSINAAMDVAVIRELFTNLLISAKESDSISGGEKADYQRVLEGAPDYQVNEYGAPREWLHDDFIDNDFHRHQSHLYPMFPGLEKARADSKTDEIYRQGGLRRMTIGLNYQTSWSLIQNAHLMARVQEGETAFESLNMAAKTCLMRNLFTTHNDWRYSGITLDFPPAPFQIDANIGWVSAVQEMLLFSNPERIDILPAIPAKWKSGEIGPLKTRCGAEVYIKWNEETVNVNITALRNTGFTLYLPDKTSMKIKMTAGENRFINSSWQIKR